MVHASSLIARLISQRAGPRSSGDGRGLLAIGGVFVGTMRAAPGSSRRGIAGTGDATPIAARRRRHRRRSADARLRSSLPKPGRSARAAALRVAAEAGIRGVHVDPAERLATEIDRAFGRHLTINATGACGALLDIAIPARSCAPSPSSRRAGRLPGHIMEERAVRGPPALAARRRATSPTRPPAEA